ncbi:MULTISPECIES: peptide ABC transporter substrate-binding protein [Thermomonosporaceae]|uniref:peptide ABC transporter substrate-binding protein n=1 Tax=Thermomonosporaceae TaxID=2012 RepID=UPI00255B1C0C|nr:MULTISPECIES: ABC transporter substrate-binding protein [Thermomonosporaceae]MDL4777380.1 ABC transporter substrate-binding protein [Actinomadura xylanilytica]
MTSLRGTGRRAAGFAAVALTASLGLSACGGGSTSSDGTFTAGHSEPDHLVPGNTTSSYSFDVLSGLFDNLVGLSKDGKPVNLAAQSLESDDQKVWTIKLQPGRTFHNGEPVEASNFADAWNNAAYGPNAYEANEYFSHIKGYAEINPEDPKAKPKSDKLSGLEVVDATTLKVTLNDSFNQFPLLLTYPAFAPMPKAAFKDAGALKKFDDHPIGNGPYQMSGDWERNKQVKLVPFAAYKGSRKPQNKGYTWKSYSSADTAYTDLRAGRLDVLQTIPAAKVPEAKRLLGDRFLPRKMGTIDYLGFPLFDDRFGNPDLRKAISMSIDRQGINKAVYNGDYIPADSLLPPIIEGHRPNACGDLCAYNPAKAKELFEKAGGFKGSLELYFSNAQPTYYQWMQIVANSLKQNLGIKDVQFRQVPSSDYFSMLSAHEEKGPYRQNWEADYPSAQNYLESMWGIGNKMTWKNKEFDGFIAKGNQAPSGAEAVKFYNQAEDVALREMPMIPLWTWAGQGGRSEKVGNVTITAYATGLLANEVTVK